MNYVLNVFYFRIENYEYLAAQKGDNAYSFDISGAWTIFINLI